MFSVAIGWFFFGLLYFKIAFDAFFRHDITTVAAMLLAVLLSGFIFLGTKSYASRLFTYNTSNEPLGVPFDTLFFKVAAPFFGFLLSFLVLSRLVVFGFSKRLNGDLDRFFDYHGSLREEVFYFLFVIAAPLTIHLLMCLYSTWNRNILHSSEDRKDSTDSRSDAPQHLKFKSGKEFFDYQCEYGETNIRPKETGIIGVVVDDDPDTVPERLRFSTAQVVKLRVASEDGGFEVLSKTYRLGEKLNKGDCAIWLPIEYVESFKMESSDSRSGWSGYIVAKIKPEINLQQDAWTVIYDYLS